MRNPFRRVHWNRKPDPRRRSARRINRRIRLYCLVDKRRLACLHGPPQSAHHSRRQRALKPKRISDRQNFLPHLQFRGIPQRQRHQRLALGLNLYHRHIIALVRSNEFSAITRPVSQHHLNRLRLLHHVEVRQNVPARINHESGSRPFHGHWIHKKVIFRGLGKNIRDRRRGLPVNPHVDRLIVRQRRIPRRNLSCLNNFTPTSRHRQSLHLPRLSLPPTSSRPIRSGNNHHRHNRQPHQIRPFSRTHFRNPSSTPPTPKDTTPNFPQRAQENLPRNL